MRGFSRSASLWAVGVFALLPAAWSSPRVIPYNMDEFDHYHALGCATAENARELPTIRDGCGYYDLRLPFATTPLRGILRHFRAFSTPEQNPAIEVLSTPAHTRVPITAPVKC